MRLGLGTVQFGIDYGISNPLGRIPREEVVRIIRAARTSGVSLLDTAAEYGDSEEVLGSITAETSSFAIVTKTPAFGTLRHDAAEVVRAAVNRSLERLRRTSIYGLLVHRPRELTGDVGRRLMDELQRLKLEGRILKVGASIYEPDEIDMLVSRFQIDLIQLPVNVLDQRWISGGHLERLRKLGVEIHARSAFLQGLLLMEPEQLHSHFDSVKPHLLRYRAFLQQKGWTPVQAALGFIRGLDVDAVIFGVNNAQQLQQVCSYLDPLPAADFSEFAISDPAVVNPTLWK